MGSLRTRTVDAMCRQRREGWLQRCRPFVRPGSLQSSTFCWMLCDPSVFYRIWFWPSADAENTKPDHDEKSLHRHTIPCFASSKSPFGLQLGSRETHHTLLTVKRRKNVVYDVTNVEQHELFGFDASRPLPDVIPKRTDSLAVVEGVLRPFLPSHCRSEGNQACLPGPLWSSSRERITHSEQVARWARTRSCSRSSILAPNSSASGSPPPSKPCRSLRGSEAEPTTNSRYSSFRGHERSLDPRRLRRAFRHSRTTNLSVLPQFVS